MGTNIDPVSGFTSPPNRADGEATFATDADTTVAEWVTNVETMNIAIDQINTVSDEIEQSASDAENSAASSASSANNKGSWSELTGAFLAGVSVNHSNSIWSLNIDVTNIESTEPSQSNGDWTETGLSRYGGTMIGDLTIEKLNPILNLTSNDSAGNPTILVTTPSDNGYRQRFFGSGDRFEFRTRLNGVETEAFGVDVALGEPVEFSRPITTTEQPINDEDVTRKDYVVSQAVGVGQDYVDLVGSRSLGVTYTNLGDGPTIVSVVLKDQINDANVDAKLIIDPDGSPRILGWNRANGGSITARMTVFGLIPKGADYAVTGGSNDIIDSWMELEA